MLRAVERARGCCIDTSRSALQPCVAGRSYALDFRAALSETSVMQGKPKVIALLNEALQEELTAITQYFLHAEMCDNWHYDKLGGYINSTVSLKTKAW